MENYKMVVKMLKQDFEIAKSRHDFQEMRDDYELLKELWSTGELDSDEYIDHELIPIVHCFAEVKNSKVELPSDIKCCVQNYGKKVIYNLEEDSIKLVLQDVDDSVIYDYYKEEGIETKFIILDKSVVLNKVARRTLELNNGDIVEICIDEQMISISPQL